MVFAAKNFEVLFDPFIAEVEVHFETLVEFDSPDLG